MFNELNNRETLSLRLQSFLFSSQVLRLAKPAKPNKTAPYVTDLCLLEILDSPAYSLCLWSILRLAAIASTTYLLFLVCWLLPSSQPVVECTLCDSRLSAHAPCVTMLRRA
jgi:hypothetical protein